MKPIFRFLLLVLLVMAAAACGGSEKMESGAGQESSDNDTSNEANLLATEEAAAPQAEEPAGDSYDEDMDDSSGTQSVSEDLVWGESRTPAQTACDLEIMPLRMGATWQYVSDDGLINWEVTKVEGDLQNATAIVTVSFDEFSFENKVTCTADEGITWTDFSKQGMSVAFPGLVMISEEVEGVFLPSHDLSTGDSWNSRQVREFTFSIEAGDVQTEASGLINMDQSDIVLSTDPVTALGIEVDGVQLEQTSVIDMNILVQDAPFEQIETLVDTIELGKGYGMMRHSVESEFGSAVWDLAAVNIP